MRKMNFNDFEGVVVKSSYHTDKSLALLLMDVNDLQGGPIATITVNMNEPGLPENWQYVKDYSENTGMLKALQNAGLVRNIHGHRRSGFVEVPLVEFNLEGVLDAEKISTSCS